MVDTMPEPPDRALVGLFAPNDELIPLVFERDNSSPTKLWPAGSHWYGIHNEVPQRWEDVLKLAASDGWQMVRLYRADDPAFTEAFNAGVNAAADAVKAEAEACGHIAYDDAWADAIAEARKAVKP